MEECLNSILKFPPSNMEACPYCKADGILSYLDDNRFCKEHQKFYCDVCKKEAIGTRMGYTCNRCSGAGGSIERSEWPSSAQVESEYKTGYTPQ